MHPFSNKKSSLDNSFPVSYYNKKRCPVPYTILTAELAVGADCHLTFLWCTSNMVVCRELHILSMCVQRAVELPEGQELHTLRMHTSVLTAISVGVCLTVTFPELLSILCTWTENP